MTGLDGTFDDALNHLRQDPIMALLVDEHGELEALVNENTFVDIVDSIVSQQLSVKAAFAIFGNVEKLLGGITPENILSTEDLALRTCGLSWDKVRYVKDLSQKVTDGTIQLDKLTVMTDEEVINHLSQVKGIGRWSAEMILMSSLNRPDVFPVDDIGIQNAFVKLYNLNRKHKTFKKKMIKIAQVWSPYRTLACRYLWKSLANAPLQR